MKILIGSLLFATAIFINFSELNSSPQPSGAGPSHVNYDIENLQKKLKTPKHVYIELYGGTIEVDIAKINNRHEAVGCRVMCAKFSIPTKTTKRSINFMTLADFKRVGTNREKNLIRIVIYVGEDTNKEPILLGAKLPPPGRNVFQEGDPRNLDPDHTKWFITYDGIDYVVKVEPVSQNKIDVKLWGRENICPTPEEIRNNWHEYHYIHFGDVYILQFVNEHNVIQGAGLDPFWEFRPGEKFAGQNPHDHMHQQIIHPIEPNPQSQKNLEQQHHFNQQQHLDQQHHLDQLHNFDPHHNAYQQIYIVPYPFFYQNPFPYAHQIPDPSQNPYHQPNLELSLYYPPQGAYPPPHFEPNQGWHHQHYPPPGP